MAGPILSKDISNLTGADSNAEPSGPIYVKRKIAFGVDGVAIDVSPDNPFPVTGTFTPKSPPGFSNFSQSTPAVITVDDTSTQLLAANPSRLFVWIINNSTSRIYIQYGIAAVYGRGYPIQPNSRYVITLSELYLGSINAVTDIGKVVEIDVLEGVE
jgi:hypothetical protein